MCKKYLIWSVNQEVILWRVDDAPDNTVSDAAKIALGRREEDEFALILKVGQGGEVTAKHEWLSKLAEVADNG